MKKETMNASADRKKVYTFLFKIPYLWCLVSVVDLQLKIVLLHVLNPLQQVVDGRFQQRDSFLNVGVVTGWKNRQQLSCSCQLEVVSDTSGQITIRDGWTVVYQWVQQGKEIESVWVSLQPIFLMEMAPGWLINCLVLVNVFSFMDETYQLPRLLDNCTSSRLPFFSKL